MNSVQWRMKTGITELDQLLRDGFLIPMAENSPRGPRAAKSEGLLVLIRGEAGTGKSSLAMQIAHNAYWGKREADLSIEHHHLYRNYSSLEQDEDQLQWRWDEMFRKLDRGHKVKVELCSAAPQENTTLGRVPSLDSEVPYTTIRDLVDRIDGAWNSKHRTKRRQVKKGAVVVLDGLSIMTPDERHEIRFAQLCKDLRRFPGICVIVYEPSESGEEILDHRADVVIELEKADLDEPVPYTIHRLQIRKTRYQEAVLGWHQYKFGPSGLEIIPSIHFQVHHPRMSLSNTEPIRLTEKRTSWNFSAKSIIEKVVGRLDHGHCVALLGPRGSFKTELSLNFLSASEPRDKDNRLKSLLVSLLGGSTKLEVQCPFAERAKGKKAKGKKTKCTREFCRLCRPRKDDERVLSFHQPPGCITPAEFLQKIRRELTKDDSISRLAFWDLTQLDHRFPLLKHDPLFLPAFLEMLGGEKKSDGPAGNLKHSVESLFMGAGNADYTRAFSAIADNVVFCWRWKPIDHELVKKEFAKKVKAENNIPNITSLFPRGKNGANFRFPSEFLLLYVDRTAGRNCQPNKCLYALPVNDGMLPLPGERSVYHIDLSQLSGLDDVKEKVLNRIDKINQMQGIE